MSKPPGQQSSGFTRPWSADEPVLPPPHPAPEVYCRDADEQEIPASAKKLRDLALANGWKVRPTYSRGNRLGAHGKPGAVVDSLVLRMTRKGREYAVACWVDGKAESRDNFVNTPDGTKRMSITGITQWVQQ